MRSRRYTTCSREACLALAVCFAAGAASALAHEGVHEQIERVTQQIAAEPSNALLYFKRGELYRAHEDWDAALADFERCASLDPSLDGVDVARGRVLYHAGWYASARAVLDRHLAKRPADAEARLWRARALAALGDHVASVADYDQAIASLAEPRPEYYLERARTIAGTGHEAETRALRGLDEGITRLGPLVTLQEYAIELELTRGNFDAALARLETLTNRATRKERWLIRRGEIFTKAGRMEQAREAYAAAIAAIAALPARHRMAEATRALRVQAVAAQREIDEAVIPSDAQSSDAKEGQE